MGEFDHGTRSSATDPNAGSDPSTSPSRPGIVVVGYGNDLRGDDAAGRWVAERLEQLAPACVSVLSCTQLVPEISLELLARRLAVFVDASIQVDQLTITDLGTDAGADGTAHDTPSPVRQKTSHFHDPSALLAMTATVGDPPARSILVSVPARDFGLGVELSDRTRRAAETAVERIIELISESIPDR